MPPPRPACPSPPAARDHPPCRRPRRRAGGARGPAVPHGRPRHRDRAAVDQHPAAQRRCAAEDAAVRSRALLDRQVLEGDGDSVPVVPEDLEDPVLPGDVPGWMIVLDRPWPTIVSVLFARLDVFWIRI